MSDAKRCDRCGEYYAPYVTRYNFIKHEALLTKGLDFCPMCEKAFINWYDQYRQQEAAGHDE